MGTNHAAFIGTTKTLSMNRHPKRDSITMEKQEKQQLKLSELCIWCSNKFCHAIFLLGSKLKMPPLPNPLGSWQIIKNAISVVDGFSSAAIIIVRVRLFYGNRLGILTALTIWIATRSARVHEKFAFRITLRPVCVCECLWHAWATEYGCGGMQNVSKCARITCALHQVNYL